MELSNKIVNILSSKSWFHATTIDNCKNIINRGILVDYNKGNELDFGFGFYLSPNIEMAERYLCRLYGQIGFEKTNLVTIEYDFCPYNFFINNKYNTAVFPKFDDAFAEFVLDNRLKCKNDMQHNYDIIYGVMSDSVPTQLLLKYKADEISKADVIEGLKKSNSMKQLSIHNQEICNDISLSKLYLFNAVTKERKEIDAL